MLTFRFRGTDGRGRALQGRVQDVSKAAARTRLASLRAIELLELDWAATMRDFAGAATSKRELSSYFFQLATLFKAGVPLAQSLETLAPQSWSPQLAEAAGCLSEDVHKGSTLSRALGRFDTLFEAASRGLVACGERTGALPVVLERLARLYEAEARRSERLRAALTYPVILLLGSATCLAGVAALFNSSLLVPAVEIGLGLALVGYTLLQTPAGRAWVRALALRTPFLGRALVASQLETLCQVLVTTHDSGMSLVHSLDLLQEVLEDDPRVAAARERTLEGDDLSAALQGFPRALRGMLKVGEESGRMTHVLRCLARYYEQESEHQLEILAQVVEPLVLLGLGIVVLITLLVMLSPLLGMLQAM